MRTFKTIAEARAALIGKLLYARDYRANMLITDVYYVQDKNRLSACGTIPTAPELGECATAVEDLCDEPY